MNDSNSRDALAALLADEAWARRLARVLVGEHDGDEIVQNVLKKVLSRSFDRFVDQTRSMRGYWRRALQNEATNLHRTRARREAREESVARGEGTAPDPAQVVQRIEQRRRLAEHLVSLPQEQSYVLILHYEEGRSAAEIARLLGVPASTVRTRLDSARTALRERLLRADPNWREGMMVLASPSALLSSATSSSLLVALVMNSPLLTVTGILVLTSVLGGLWLLGEGEGLGQPELKQAALEAELSSDDLGVVSSETRTVAVNEPGAQAIETVDSAQEPEIARNDEFQLTARLLDREGNAIPGARLTLFGINEIELVADRDGRIDARLPRNDFGVGSSFSWKATEDDGGHAWGASSIGKDDRVIILGDLRLTPVAHFGGRVVDEDGRPIEGVALTMRWVERGDPFSTSTDYWGGSPTDADGRFEGSRAQGGLAIWQVRGGGWSSEPVTVELKLGLTIEIDEIVCTKLPLPTAPTISFTDDEGRSVVPERVLLRVRDRVSELDPKRITLELESYLGDQEPLEVLAWSRARGLWRAWGGLVGEARPKLTLSLQPMRSIRLRAVDSDSKPVAIQSVAVSDALWGRTLVEATDLAANESGVLELLVPDRAIEVQVSVGRDPEPLAIELVSLPAEIIEVRVANPFDLFEGRVSFEGNPVGAARVSLHAGARGGMSFTIDDAPGRFDGASTHVAQTTTATGAFTLPWAVELPAVLVVRALGFPDRVVDLTADPTGEELSIELQRAGRIEGQVRYADEATTAGMKIALLRGALDSRTARVDTDGRFVFENVAPGSWYLQPSRFEMEIASDLDHDASPGDPWSPSRNPDVEVIAGETANVELLLEQPAQHKLQGTITVDGVPMSGWRVRAFPQSASDYTGSQAAETATADDGHFTLVLRGPGPFNWSAGPPSGWPIISREATFAAGNSALDWQLDLHTAILNVQVGSTMSRVGYRIDLGGGFSAAGVADDNEHRSSFRCTVLAGELQLRTSSQSPYPLADPGPFDLRAGEVLQVSLP